MRASESPFQSYKSKRICFSLIFLLVSGLKALKKRVCVLPNSVAVKSYGMFWNSIRKMWSVCTEIALIEKNISKEKFADTFLLFCVNLPTVKIWGQSDKFPVRFSSLQCPIQVKKLIPENSAKWVIQSGNFCFRPKLKTAISLPIFNLIQWFLFLHFKFDLDHYLNRKIEIWKKLPICRYNITLNHTTVRLCVLTYLAGYNQKYIPSRISQHHDRWGSNIHIDIDTLIKDVIVNPLDW